MAAHRAIRDPILSDDVVILRTLTATDLDGIDAGIHDPMVVRWVGPPPGTARDALELNRARAAQGSPTFSIRDQADTFLGLAWINRSATEPSTGFVGYWLLPAARGHGYATRAVRLLTGHAVHDLELRRVGLVTEAANSRSRRVAERAGFTLVATARDEPGGDGRPVEKAVYELPVRER